MSTGSKEEREKEGTAGKGREQGSDLFTLRASTRVVPVLTLSSEDLKAVGEGDIKDEVQQGKNRRKKG